MGIDINSIKSAYEIFMKNKTAVDHEDVNATTVTGDVSAILVEVTKVKHN